jgi:hypothetical protein
MKRMLIAALVLLVFAITANAETPQKKGQMPPKQGMMGSGMMQGGQMPMMQHMIGHGMMMQEMMHMMKDMMKMQERMIGGASDEDKKMMRQELNRMMERMDKMMTDMQGMMMKCMMGMPPAEQPKGEPKKDAPQKPQEHKH